MLTGFIWLKYCTIAGLLSTVINLQVS